MEPFANKKNAAYPGLCASCDKQPVCTYPRVRPRPVLQCLEFEEMSAAAAGRILQGRSGSRLGVRVRVRVEPERLEPGLCADCELRDGCTYPRMPGGVWFCDEYR
jgi:hypothetical protein